MRKYYYACIWITAPSITSYKFWPNLCILNSIRVIRVYNGLTDKVYFKTVPVWAIESLGPLIKLKQELLLLNIVLYFFYQRVTENENVRAKTWPNITLGRED